MSRMSDLAIDIEEALDDGRDITSIIDSLQGDYGISRTEAFELITQTSFLLTLDRDQEIM
jgi:hypothetical protein